MDMMPDVNAIREYETEYLDAQLTAAFEAIDQLNAKSNVESLYGRNRKMWQEYRNRMLRIADARGESQFYRWFDEHTLDETP